ncbi:unnamed protein product [Paramecium octaurelia]|uniref:Uncharacterized protein n=1 Tax=Paramecium octaurelia TaxID=43137 RepID=A0A8S1V2B7_PAROT|nr:unnamed protein product [Paramecium octaurelia]
MEYSQNQLLIILRLTYQKAIMDNQQKHQLNKGSSGLYWSITYKLLTFYRNYYEMSIIQLKWHVQNNQAIIKILFFQQDVEDFSIDSDPYAKLLTMKVRQLNEFIISKLETQLNYQIKSNVCSFAIMFEYMRQQHQLHCIIISTLILIWIPKRIYSPR